MAPGAVTKASVRRRATFWCSGEVAVLVVVDLLGHRLIEAGVPGNAQAQGHSGKALVLARAAQPHKLGGDGVEAAQGA